MEEDLFKSHSSCFTSVSIMSQKLCGKFHEKDLSIDSVASLQTFAICHFWIWPESEKLVLWLHVSAVAWIQSYNRNKLSC